MASIVFYFQVHQPFRLKKYTVFEEHPFYFASDKNEEICRKVARKCYIPATRTLLDLAIRHEGNFRVSFSVSGVALEQFEMWAPEVIDLLGALAATGCCEFMAETHHHSLSFLYSKQEFVEQVDMHTRKVRALFGQTPTVFRNTELIYSNELAAFLAGMKDEAGRARFKGVCCEGVDWLLQGRSPNYVYAPPRGGEGRHGGPFALLLKNFRLSDDVAFRFSNRGWAEWPLTAEKFARWANDINGDGYLCNLFMDYETFGEHQWAETGIFDFLSALPEKWFDINPGHNHFMTVSEAIERFPPVGTYDAPGLVSWADTERDLSAWLGNSMQRSAIDEAFRMEQAVKSAWRAAEQSGDGGDREAAGHILNDWRRLLTSDHFYYMCTKYFADGDVHKYFNPYDSPYDSYINYMNVLDNLRARLAAVPQPSR